MNTFYPMIIILLFSFSFSQDFNAEEYFDLIFQDGLMMFEVPEGGYISGVEVLKYDRKNKNTISTYRLNIPIGSYH